MNGVGLIGAIIIGIFAGWIAEKVLRRNDSLLVNLIAGVVGAFLGSFIATRLGFTVGAGIIPSLLISTVGAIVLLFIVGLFQRRRRI
jgi:uncharacterized membrane protein YeaQ/YmgE (transglycosylase-associated protein family)